MCEPGRRCDKSYCPCNEAEDGGLKDALQMMQERFPAPWVADVEYDDFSEQCCSAASLGAPTGPGVHGRVCSPVRLAGPTRLWARVAAW